MAKKRVAMLCAGELLGESLEHLLKNVADISVIGPWALDDRAISHLSEMQADIVLIVEPESEAEFASQVTGQILERFPGLPVIRVTTENNIVRVYNSRILPARSEELIDLIRDLPVFNETADQ